MISISVIYITMMKCVHKHVCMYIHSQKVSETLFNMVKQKPQVITGYMMLTMEIIHGHYKSKKMFAILTKLSYDI